MATSTMAAALLAAAPHPASDGLLRTNGANLHHGLSVMSSACPTACPHHPPNGGAVWVGAHGSPPCPESRGLSSTLLSVQPAGTHRRRIGGGGPRQREGNGERREEERA